MRDVEAPAPVVEGGILELGLEYPGLHVEYHGGQKLIVFLVDEDSGDDLLSVALDDRLVEELAERLSVLHHELHYLVDVHFVL
jgi:hypothetical protein